MLNLNRPVQRLYKPVCPLCKGTVDRVPRSLLDRFRSLFMPRGRVLYRYQCWAPACAWQGSLKRQAGRRDVYGAEGSRRHVLAAAQMTEVSR